MKHKLLGLAAACLLLGNIPLASAALFDFPALIDGNTGSITGTLANGSAFSGNPGENAFQNFSWTVDGLTLTASASHVSDPTVYAYLDEIFQGRGGGLGVCQSVTSGNQCSPSSDDNVTVGEVLTTSFNQMVSIDFGASVLRDTDHYIYSTDYPYAPYVEVSVDSNGWTMLDPLSILTGTVFDFRTLQTGSQFYLSELSVSAVPEPSTYLLMGIGLLLLGFVSRRQLA
jgi:hypothetical protein